MFPVGHSSSCPSSGDKPRSKDVKANIAERGCGNKLINRKIGHFLCILPTPLLLTLNAVVNGAVHSSLASNYPEPTALDQAE